MARRNKQPIKAALLAALLCLSAAAQPQTITGKVVAIADGDTLTVLMAALLGEEVLAEDYETVRRDRQISSLGW
jgi:hypothetical protein